MESHFFWINVIYVGKDRYEYIKIKKQVVRQLGNRGKIWAVVIIVAVLIIIGLICYFNRAEGVETITNGTLI